MSAERPSLRLAVIGDTHYTNGAYHRRALAGQSANPNEAAGVRRHLRSTAEVLPRLVEEVRAARPDLVIQLGDVVQGHCDDAAGDRAELGEALELLRGIERPLLFARGTHEGRHDGPAGAAYRDLYLREIARTLGSTAGAAGSSTALPAYALEHADCRLIVLDYTTFEPGGEGDQVLQEELRRASGRGERILVFGHPPLVPVARPFFSRPDFAQTVLARLAAAPAPVDAYFCGHTHNQVASLHRIEHAASGSPYWLPQLQGVPVGVPEQSPVALDAVRPLLPPRDAFQHGWAVLQGGMPGWFLVEVGAEGVEDVTAQWRPIGSALTAGEVRWQRAGAPEIVRRPALPEAPPAPDWPLAVGDPRVTSVWLRPAGTGSRAPHRVRLNGREIGTLGTLESFNAGQGLSVPPGCWPAIAGENELVVEPVAPEERCLGGFVLEVTLATGGVARSVPPEQWYAASDRWEGWRWATPQLYRVAPDEAMRFTLRFASQCAPPSDEIQAQERDQ